MSTRSPIALLITSGDGPAECNMAVAHILDRMDAEAQTRGLSLDIDTTPARHGPKSAVVVVHGADAGAFARRWTGTIRWRAQSTLRPHHKRANWFVGVFALPPRMAGMQRIDPHDVSYESFRAGGPGGQHQNKTDSAVRARHHPTGLIAAAREERSQHRNKALALERLQALLDARTTADEAQRKSHENRLHHGLERGNPVRCFKGSAFREERR